MKKTRIMSIVGARPNFMKIAPFAHELARHTDGLEHVLVHTGQHYDKEMSDAFFETLRIPKPDVHLGIGSGSHAEQVGQTMIALEKVIRDRHPDWIVVVGDINATCAGSITAKKEHVRLAHIEAGLRSFDLTMPEEINRMVTDRLSDALFTPDAIADANLRHEGAPEEAILRVGNIMIDTLEAHRSQAAALNVDDIVRAGLIGKASDRPFAPLDKGYAVLTLHRPSNVDDPGVLSPLVRFFLDDVAADMPLIWTIHPRTRKHLDTAGLWGEVEGASNLHLLGPQGYLEMLRLNMGARLMLTDSGGLQEECCVLGTPCITLRENTERPVTLREHGGPCELAGNRIDSVRRVYAELKDAPRKASRPPLWDGRTAQRIAGYFVDWARRQGGSTR